MKNNKITITLNTTSDNVLESKIEIDGIPFDIKFKEGNLINLTMTRGFAARQGLRVQKGMFFNEGDFRSWVQSPIMKGTINILGLEFKDTYFERFHESPGKIYMGLDYFEKATIDIVNKKLILETTQEHFNKVLTERNSKYNEENDYDPDTFSFTVYDDKTYYDIPKLTRDNKYLVEKIKEEKEAWEKQRRNPITNLEIHEYNYEPMDYIIRISEEIFKCYTDEYGEDSDKFLEAWDWNSCNRKNNITKEEMIKQYENWKNNRIEEIWEPKYNWELRNLDDESEGE